MTVNEYAYLSIFLYPHYMENVYQEYKKSIDPMKNLIEKENKGETQIETVNPRMF